VLGICSGVHGVREMLRRTSQRRDKRPHRCVIKLDSRIWLSHLFLLFILGIVGLPIPDWGIIGTPCRRVGGRPETAGISADATPNAMCILQHCILILLKAADQCSPLTVHMEPPGSVDQGGRKKRGSQWDSSILSATGADIPNSHIPIIAIAAWSACGRKSSSS
jgi:hypothetical protein